MENLKNQVAHTKSASAQQKKVDSQVVDYYRRAEIYLNKNRARSADKMYARIAAIDPGHKGLKPLGRRIADAYSVLAQKEIDARDCAMLMFG